MVAHGAYCVAFGSRPDVPHHLVDPNCHRLLLAVPFTLPPSRLLLSRQSLVTRFLLARNLSRFAFLGENLRFDAFPHLPRIVLVAFVNERAETAPQPSSASSRVPARPLAGPV